jgi:hypothetical protein
MSEELRVAIVDPNWEKTRRLLLAVKRIWISMPSNGKGKHREWMGDGRWLMELFMLVSLDRVMTRIGENQR